MTLLFKYCISLKRGPSRTPYNHSIKLFRLRRLRLPSKSPLLELELLILLLLLLLLLLPLLSKKDPSRLSQFVTTASIRFILTVTILASKEAISKLSSTASTITLKILPLLNIIVTLFPIDAISTSLMSSKPLKTLLILFHLPL